MRPAEVGGERLGVASRVQAHLRRGNTVAAIASAENLSPVLVEIIVDDLSRRGRLMPAESLCASGLGACGGGKSPEIALHCAGCPLVPLRLRSA